MLRRFASPFAHWSSLLAIALAISAIAAPSGAVPSVSAQKGKSDCPYCQVFRTDGSRDCLTCKKKFAPLSVFVASDKTTLRGHLSVKGFSSQLSFTVRSSCSLSGSGAFRGGLRWDGASTTHRVAGSYDGTRLTLRDYRWIDGKEVPGLNLLIEGDDTMTVSANAAGIGGASYILNGSGTVSLASTAAGWTPPPGKGPYPPAKSTAELFPLVPEFVERLRALGSVDGSKADYQYVLGMCVVFKSALPESFLEGYLGSRCRWIVNTDVIVRDQIIAQGARENVGKRHREVRTPDSFVCDGDEVSHGAASGKLGVDQQIRMATPVQMSERRVVLDLSRRCAHAAPSASEAASEERAWRDALGSGRRFVIRFEKVSGLEIGFTLGSFTSHSGQTYRASGKAVLLAADTARAVDLTAQQPCDLVATMRGREVELEMFGPPRRPAPPFIGNKMKMKFTLVSGGQMQGTMLAPVSRIDPRPYVQWR